MSTLSEHRGYLVDDRRISRYARAIDQVVSSGDLVADLGCGFGILGLSIGVQTGPLIGAQKGPPVRMAER